jgi:hypothetical protein
VRYLAFAIFGLGCRPSVFCAVLVAELSENDTLLPIRGLFHLVESWLALFTEVLVGEGSLVMETHATAMLPNHTVVALHKKVSNIFADQIVDYSINVSHWMGQARLGVLPLKPAAVTTAGDGPGYSDLPQIHLVTSSGSSSIACWS